MTNHLRLLNLAGYFLIAAVWLLGMVTPPRGGLKLEFVLAYTGLLGGLALAERFAPPASAPMGRRIGWLAGELMLAALMVQTHGSLVRPALIYLLPASRALLLFGERPGLLASLSVWLAYTANIALVAWPDRLYEFPNYFSFLLGPDVVIVVLTLAALRQERDRRHVQQLYDDLRAAQEELQQLAVTQERNRLAREIHDNLAHYLTVINVQLEAAEKLGSERAERALEEVKRARRLAVECLREVRRSVAALRAASLEELSLPTALQKLASEFSQGTGLRIRLDAPPDLQVSPEAALALYRVAQEGLTNVQRHARATQLDLRLVTQDGFIHFTVEDDGGGPAGGDGYGITGLRERVELLGGSLTFGPREAHGSRLAATIPR